MIERPILFNTEMVNAILDGRKTQTRRLVKEILLDEQHFTVEGGVALACDCSGYWYRAEKYCHIQPGDVLWVRETWAKDVGRYMYKANYSDTEKFYMNGREIKMFWRPSIHMPRKAARLFLRVKSVKVERLHEMNIDSFLAEGVPWEYGRIGMDVGHARAQALLSIRFRAIWDSTIKPADLPRYGMDANPWVWVIEFERCSGEVA